MEAPSWKCLAPACLLLVMACGMPRTVHVPEGPTPTPVTEQITRRSETADASIYTRVGGTFRGRQVQVTADSVIWMGGTPPVRKVLARPLVDRIVVTSNESSSIKTGAMAGTLAGAVAGGLVWATGGKEESGYDVRPVAFFALGAAGALLGAAAGAISARGQVSYQLPTEAPPLPQPTPLLLSPGRLVRLHDRTGEPTVGTLVDIGPDSLYLAPDEGPRVARALADLERLEVGVEEPHDPGGRSLTALMAGSLVGGLAFEAAGSNAGWGILLVGLPSAVLSRFIFPGSSVAFVPVALPAPSPGGRR